jgi:rhomboid family GlyGly-CTERM serine protease
VARPGFASQPGAAVHPVTRPAWIALATLLGTGALAAWFVDRPLLDWQPALVWSQPWRWWTAAWVHLSPMHLAVNLLGTALLVALGWVAHCERRDAAAWFVAWPLTHLGLLLQPTLAHYGGLSGVLHAGVVVAAIGLARRERQARRALGLTLLLGVAVKLLLEQPWQGPLREVPGWDIAIAPAAHLSGACAGALCALVPWRWPQPRQR